ncbi:MAG: OmpA family protein [Myxococcales bacterium]|nr:OmpA family protein [Myxococcales bacterium]
MPTKRLPLLAAIALLSCGGATSSPDTTPVSGTTKTQGTSEHNGSTSSTESSENEFQIKDSTTAGTAHGASESKIIATKTETAMKFFVIDKAKNEPISGIVISLGAPDGKKYYTEETDTAGYGEVLVPAGQSYELVYLTLGRKDITARVKVKNEPNQNIKLTLRYTRHDVEPAAAHPATPDAPTPPPAPPKPQPVFRLDGVTFDTASSELLPESYPRLDSVVEYMTHKKSARIEVAGHTDSVGNAKNNKALSEARAQACRTYLVGKGIDGDRIAALGYGDEMPVASNQTEDGRRENRRIEAREL